MEPRSPRVCVLPLRDSTRPLLFTGGYLLVWGAGGLLSYGLFRLGNSVLGGDLAWRSGGRFVAGGVLAVAALYELTPLKHVCLAKGAALPMTLRRAVAPDEG